MERPTLPARTSPSHGAVSLHLTDEAAVAGDLERKL